MLGAEWIIWAISDVILVTTRTGSTQTPLRPSGTSRQSCTRISGCWAARQLAVIFALLGSLLRAAARFLTPPATVAMPTIKFTKEKKEIQVPVGANLRKEAMKAGINLYQGLNGFG